MPSVRLENVSKNFGRIQALKDINLTIKDGEYLAIIGPSGCGKTTLVNCITGIIPVSTGDIYFDKLNVKGYTIEERNFAMVFQSIALFPHMKVEENVSYGPFVKNMSRKEREKISEKMLRLVDLLEQKKLVPRLLSGGAKQKTAVARALATGHKLLILDEPISALDYKVRVALRYELRRLVKDLGLTAIHITHDQEEALSIADRVVIMRAGEIIEVGKPQELYDKPSSLFTMNFVGECNFLEGIVNQKTGTNGYLELELRKNIRLRLKNAHHKKFDEGDSIVIAIRPENLEITDTAGTDAIQGKIIGHRFYGAFNRYKIRLVTEDDILFDTKSTISSKEKVFIRLIPDKTRIYKTPKYGLLKVLELE
ncbi:MAG: ABC transporter ATP-binding protein [Candidatus Hodarchaeales archaeon]